MNEEVLNRATELLRFNISQEYLDKIYPYEPFVILVKADEVNDNIKLSVAKSELIDLLTEFKWYCDRDQIEGTPIETETSLKNMIKTKLREIADILEEHARQRETSKLENKKHMVQVISLIVGAIIGVLGLWAGLLKKENDEYKDTNKKLKSEIFELKARINPSKVLPPIEYKEMEKAILKDN